MNGPTPITVRTPRMTLRLGGRAWIAGILNVTPDSFSDGGRFLDPAAAIAHGEKLAADGADVLDVGAESTRPGSIGVPPEQQLQRVIPVIAGLRAGGIELPISVDTRSSLVAAAALDAGADIVNDVSALQFDASMSEVCRGRGAAVILMHMQGDPSTMQAAPAYVDAPAEVRGFLHRRAMEALRFGISNDRIILDPGIGFGKTGRHNFELIRNLSAICGLGYPVMIGVSRKAFVGAVIHEPDPRRRDHASAVLAAICAIVGVHLIRAHDVVLTRQAIAIAESMTNQAAF